MTQYKLIEFLDDRGIDTVVFDLDNTLLATGEYYRQKTFQLGVELAKIIDPGGDLEKISKEIEGVIYEQYEKDGRKPSLIDDRYILGLKEYLDEDIPNELIEFVYSFFKDFYLHSPTPFEDTPRVLRALIESNRKVALHSHAQKEWTQIKVDLLTKLIGYNLPFLATDIDQNKDRESWLKAFELVDSSVDKTMVVGDNFESDILPCVEVGCKNLAYVNKSGRDIPKDYSFEDSVRIVEIDEIGDILDNLNW